MKFNKFTTNKPFNLPYREQAPFNSPNNTLVGRNTSLPFPPHSVSVIFPFTTGLMDIRWADATLLPENSSFQIVGYNVYRSFDSEAGIFEKVNEDPIEILSFRDSTINKFEMDEDVSDRLIRGTTSGFGEWYFTTKNKPIVKSFLDKKIYADTPNDVVVKVDNRDGKGLIEVPIKQVIGVKGEIHLISTAVFDPVLQKLFEPRLPVSELDTIVCSYHYNMVDLNQNFNRRIFYKVTSVCKDKTGATLETDLRNVKAQSFLQGESIDFVWREAIRRNRWILEQGGERVKILPRKWAGHVCTEGGTPLHNSRGKADCPMCYGTGFINGYERAIDIIIAPPDEEKKIEFADLGVSVNMVYETWTGPSPLIQKKDIIIRSTGERYFVGNVKYVGSRGNYLQQHFTLSQADFRDIVYQIPLEGGPVVKELIDKPMPPKDTTRTCADLPIDSPVIPSDKTAYTPREKTEQDKGRTITYENIEF